MSNLIETHTLTHQAVMKMLQAGLEKAEEIGQPQCLVVVDQSGETLGELRMTGAKFLSRKSALTKARTAASNRGRTDAIPVDFRAPIAAATQGSVTGLPGGLPIMMNGQCIGGVGVGSGSGEQDIAVGNAMLSVIGAETFA